MSRGRKPAGVLTAKATIDLIAQQLGKDASTSEIVSQAVAQGVPLSTANVYASLRKHGKLHVKDGIA